MFTSLVNSQAVQQALAMNERAKLKRPVPKARVSKLSFTQEQLLLEACHTEVWD
jgi:hypothetical protein